MLLGLGCHLFCLHCVCGTLSSSFVLFLFFVRFMSLEIKDMGRTKSFKEQLTFEQRVKESQDVKAEYPDRVPVIVEKYAKCDLPLMDKRRYLVPKDMSVGQFVYNLSGRVQLPPGKALFVFAKNTLPPTASLMSFVYETYKDEDGYLYMCYSTEKAFGHAS